MSSALPRTESCDEPPVRFSVDAYIDQQTAKIASSRSSPLRTILRETDWHEPVSAILPAAERALGRDR
jgi:hypothetical protein